MLIQIKEVQTWRSKRVLDEMPRDFNPARYVSIGMSEKVENPVPAEQIHAYVNNSRLVKRFG